MFPWCFEFRSHTYFLAQKPSMRKVLARHPNSDALVFWFKLACQPPTVGMIHSCLLDDQKSEAQLGRKLAQLLQLEDIHGWEACLNLEGLGWPKGLGPRGEDKVASFCNTTNTTNHDLNRPYGIVRMNSDILIQLVPMLNFDQTKVTLRNFAKSTKNKGVKRTVSHGAHGWKFVNKEHVFLDWQTSNPWESSWLWYSLPKPIAAGFCIKRGSPFASEISKPWIWWT